MQNKNTIQRFIKLPCISFFSVNTARFLKYVWPFYNIMHESVKKTNASLYYRFLLDLICYWILFFYRQYFQLRCSSICVLKEKENFSGIISLHTNIPSSCSYWRETASFVTFPEAVIGRCSKKYLWEGQHFCYGCKND